MHDLIKKIGVERRIITQGANKSVFDPFTPAKESDIKLISQMQKQVHEHFIDFVKSRRKTKLTQSDEILFNGEFWAGKTALDFGLIDGIDNLHNFIKNKFGDKVNIEYVRPKESWFKKKFMSSINADDLVEAASRKYEQEIISSRFKLY
jgi:ClpP class serine protease